MNVKGKAILFMPSFEACLALWMKYQRQILFSLVSYLSYWIMIRITSVEENLHSYQ